MAFRPGFIESAPVMNFPRRTLLEVASWHPNGRAATLGEYLASRHPLIATQAGLKLTPEVTIPAIAEIDDPDIFKQITLAYLNFNPGYRFSAGRRIWSNRDVAKEVRKGTDFGLQHSSNVIASIALTQELAAVGKLRIIDDPEPLKPENTE